jgi:LysR family transcriptional regulator, glycine cleavage system transcriptional activator
MPVTNVPLPSFDALVAFESAARHESFTRAAAELHVTQGAISRQIRVLEDRLGVLLFQRVRRSVVLAEAGRAYLLDVRSVLNHLESATVRLMTAAERTNLLNLAVLPSIATHWLIPRLPDFLSRHPDVSVSCTIRHTTFDFTSEPFDAAFHVGSPTWPSTVAYYLMSECLVPVCTSAFRSTHGICRVDDLPRVPLLQVASQPAAWATWFERIKLPTSNACQGLIFDNFAMVTAAAIAGLGVALLPTFLVEAELSEHQLVALAPPHSNKHAYYLVVPEAKAALPHMKAFVRWIKEAKQGPLTKTLAGSLTERERTRKVAS